MVPENMHAPSHGVLWFKPPPPPPPGISSLASYFPFNILAFETSLPLGISNDLPWGWYGYFLEPHLRAFKLPPSTIWVFLGCKITASFPDSFLFEYSHSEGTSTGPGTTLDKSFNISTCYICLLETKLCSLLFERVVPFLFTLVFLEILVGTTQMANLMKAPRMSRWGDWVLGTDSRGFHHSHMGTKHDHTGKLWFYWNINYIMSQLTAVQSGEQVLTVFSKSWLKHSNNFWLLLFNQETVRALTNTNAPKIVAPA